MASRTVWGHISSHIAYLSCQSTMAGTGQANSCCCCHCCCCCMQLTCSSHADLACLSVSLTLFVSKLATSLCLRRCNGRLQPRALLLKPSSWRCKSRSGTWQTWSASKSNRYGLCFLNTAVCVAFHDASAIWKVCMLKIYSQCHQYIITKSSLHRCQWHMQPSAILAPSVLCTFLLVSSACGLACCLY
jgi:hypothetical protein